MRVLLAEDDLHHQRLLQLAILEAVEDADITAVTTGSEFIARQGGERYDVGLLDYYLPDMSADQILARTQNGRARPPIIVLSAAKDRNTVIASLRAGGRDFLPKEEAFDPKNLSTRIKAVLKQAKLEERLLQQQKDECVTTLAGGIAHDFNNLLVAILGNASLAQEELSPDSPVRRLTRRIERAARRAADLTQQLLAFSGKAGFVREQLSVSDLAREMASLLEASIPKKVTLAYDFPEQLPFIEGDATQIRQAIMNLILNASEAIGDKRGLITIRTGVVEADHAYLADTHHEDHLPEGSYVFVQITDTGCGMDETTKSKIFDPFFTTKSTGRGLGLAATLGIVRGHRGAIDVHSEPGRRTAVTVLFPVCEAPDEQGEEQEAPAASPRGTGTVLVVDDEEDVRSVAEMALERSGFTVLTASDGREALEVFGAHRDEIDAVLLDLTMPELSGEEVFRKLRRIRADVRVILSSGYVEQDATARFDGMGLAGFIQKPYLLPALVGKVREVL
jgi:two-component system cell cycle sensor histidine kinase/response regulator CckA